MKLPVMCYNDTAIYKDSKSLVPRGSFFILKEYVNCYGDIFEMTIQWNDILFSTTCSEEWFTSAITVIGDISLDNKYIKLMSKVLLIYE